jgi:sporulation protein YlmC with PRC-barrel domain
MMEISAEDTSRLQPAPGAENLRGWPVYDTNGAEIGEVSDLVQDEKTKQGETPYYLEVEHPSEEEFGLTKSWIPFDAVVAVDGEGITIEASTQRFELGGCNTATDNG